MLTPQFDDVTRCSWLWQEALTSWGGREHRRSVDCAGGVNYRLRLV